MIEVRQVKQYLDGGTIAATGTFEWDNKTFNKVMVDRSVSSDRRGLMTGHRFHEGRRKAEPVPRQKIRRVAEAIAGRMAEDVPDLDEDSVKEEVDTLIEEALSA